MKKGKLICLCGIALSGKSTYAQQYIKDNPNSIWVSSDNIREELLGDVNNQDNNTLVFDTMYRRTVNHLMAKRTVIYDCTFLGRKKRISLLNRLSFINFDKEVMIFVEPMEELMRRNTERERKIPEDVMLKMYKSFVCPQYFEGWDKISISNMYFYKDAYKTDLEINRNISQDNPNHTLTIGEHCIKASKYISDRSEEIIDKYGDKTYLELYFASLLHDCGKRETKVFTTMKGVPTEDGHYYNHENVSAYKSLWMLKEYFTSKGEEVDIDFLLDVAFFINYHMRPHLVKMADTDKARKKLIDLIGEEKHELLMLVHEADINAR